MLYLKTGGLIWLITLLVACQQAPKASKTFRLTNGLFTASLSENFALLGTFEGYAELWEIQGKPSLIHQWKHTDKPNGMIATDIASNENYAITAEKNSIAWWRISDGILLAVWGLEGINSAHISADGQFALIGLDNKAIYLNLKYGRTLYAFEHDDKVISTDLSNSGHYAVTGSADYSAKLWDLSTGYLKYTWQHQNKVSTVALSSNDTYALTNAAFGQTHLWSLSTGQLHKNIGSDIVTLSTAQFSHQHKSVLLGQISQRIELWNIYDDLLKQFWRPKIAHHWIPSATTILALNVTQTNHHFYSIASNGYLQKWQK